MARYLPSWLLSKTRRRAATAAAAAAVAVLAAGIALHLRAAGDSPAAVAALEHCAEGEFLQHEVRWAAACMALAERGQGDGIADCELPDEVAAKLYALLREGDEACRPRGMALRLAGLVWPRE